MSVNAEKLYNKIIESENRIDVDELILKAYCGKKESEKV